MEYNSDFLQIIFENYQIIDVISERSKVYLIKLETSQLDSKLLKKVPKEFIKQPIVLKEFHDKDLFERESNIMKTLEALSKKNWERSSYRFLRLYYSGNYNGRFRIFFEYCENGSMKDAIVKKKIDSFGEMIDKFYSIMSTINLMHRDKFYHRDLKPDNIFLASDNSPVIGDFGLAILGSSSKVVGTPNYMSPYHRNLYKNPSSRARIAEPINYEREDLYCVGKTFYEYSVMKIYENFENYHYEDIKIKIFESLMMKNMPRVFGESFTNEETRILKNQIIRIILNLIEPTNEYIPTGSTVFKDLSIIRKVFFAENNPIFDSKDCLEDDVKLLNEFSIHLNNTGIDRNCLIEIKSDKTMFKIHMTEDSKIKYYTRNEKKLVRSLKNDSDIFSFICEKPNLQSEYTLFNPEYSTINLNCQNQNFSIPLKGTLDLNANSKTDEIKQSKTSKKLYSSQNLKLSSSTLPELTSKKNPIQLIKTTPSQKELRSTTENDLMIRRSNEDVCNQLEILKVAKEKKIELINHSKLKKIRSDSYLICFWCGNESPDINLVCKHRYHLKCLREIYPLLKRPLTIEPYCRKCFKALESAEIDLFMNFKADSFKLSHK